MFLFRGASLTLSHDSEMDDKLANLNFLISAVTPLEGPSAHHILTFLLFPLLNLLMVAVSAAPFLFNSFPPSILTLNSYLFLRFALKNTSFHLSLFLYD